MKKSITLLFSILFMYSIAIGQHGFIIDLQTSALDKIDLTTATKTNVGTTQSNIVASDFGPGGLLYAIDSLTNGFYEIDTITGTATLLGTNAPPANHIWTGLAYDENTGIMYGFSFNDIAGSDGTLYTIDVSDGSYTVVGFQNGFARICAIAIDQTGQIYGLMRGTAFCRIVLISSIGGVSSVLSPMNESFGAGMGYGMDYKTENQTMYLTFYNSQTGQNTLRTVNLTTGQTVTIGNINTLASTIATAPILTASFSADVTQVCVGDVVNFTGISNYASSWSWTFEGGTPATSTNQNPTITYNTSGIFDVTLEASAGTATFTTSVPDAITVIDSPAQPSTPTGPVVACGFNSYTYATDSVPWADTYLWEVLPADAGSISGSDTSAIFEAAGDWTGTYTIKVQASNTCGTGTWSSELSCTLTTGAEPFFVEGGGGYCEGGQGIEVTLAGSETGVDYELFLDDVSTGIIMAGTGSPLSFGYQTDEGIYSVIGYIADCSTTMLGDVYVYVIYVPATGSQPIGPEEVCSNDITDYQADPIPDADDIIWILNPIEAGEIIGTGENISIEWAADYSGLAYLSVYGTNSCGDGPSSDDLEINVAPLPEPEVVGEILVCKDHENIYSTNDNPGSTYIWEIEGGNITNGTGTSEITILWTAIGTGAVIVTETSAEACEGISETLQVNIDDCTGIGESIVGGISIYPNPAKDKINISFNTDKPIEYEVKILNQFGQIIYTAPDNHNGKKVFTLVDITSMPTGLYYVIVTTSTNQVYKSIFEVIH